MDYNKLSDDELMGEAAETINELAAERDRYKAAIERVRKECDAIDCEAPMPSSISPSVSEYRFDGARIATGRIRSAIGDVGEQPAQQTQEGNP